MKTVDCPLSTYPPLIHSFGEFHEKRSLDVNSSGSRRISDVFHETLPFLVYSRSIRYLGTKYLFHVKVGSAHFKALHIKTMYGKGD